MYGVPDASPFNGAKNSFYRPTFAADAPQIGGAQASPAVSTARKYPPASGRRSVDTGRRSIDTGRSRSTEPASTFRSVASSYSYADTRASPLPGLFPQRAKSSFECVRLPFVAASAYGLVAISAYTCSSASPSKRECLLLQLSDDLHAGGSFVPYRGMPGYADPSRRYQTLKQTNGTTYMDEDGEDARRQQRYRNKLEGRLAAEQRIAASYEAEEEVKKQQEQRSIRRKARMVEKYEATVAREEAARTRVVRKKALTHDGERLYREGECIAGRKGIGALGRQTVFPFTKYTTADPCNRELDDGYIKHVAGNREAKKHTGLRDGSGGGGGGGGVQISFQVK